MTMIEMTAPAPSIDGAKARASLPFPYLWAKAGNSEGQFHPLICHLLDVGAVAKAMLARSVPLSVQRRLGTIGSDAFLAASCALHDLGKASPAFQAKRAELAKSVEENGLPVGRPANSEAAPHGLVTLWTLPRLLEDRKASYRTARELAAVLAAHHGLFPTDFQALTPYRELAGTNDKGTTAWDACRGQLVTEILAALGADVPCGEIGTDAAVLLAGLCSIADWIGSNTSWFPYAQADRYIDTSDYLRAAHDRASRAIDELHWNVWAPRQATFSELFQTTPRPLQLEAEAIANALEGQALVIVEAPMGEGKTEAALLIAQALAAKAGYGGFYFALPTQATANQMLSRLKAFLKQTMPPGDVNLQLVHSASLLDQQAGGAESAAEDISGIWDDADGEARVVAGEWFSQRKRGLLSPFGVGTVDQVLLAGLRTKHVFVRLFGLAGKIVIIDEAHAYDTYMSTVLDRTIQWLAALGASVIVLSATLPSRRRSELVSSWTQASVEVAQPDDCAGYPRITVVDRRSATSTTFEPSRRMTVRFIEKPWGLADPLQAQAFSAALVEAVKDGGCVAVVCNTVSEAQRLYRALMGQVEHEPGIWTGLAHSRFCAEDRARWERDLIRLFGPSPGARRPEKAILVATQVIEQSLDLDFDLLVTALAPIDLMLQRIGRLHRHQNARPAHMAVPTCWWFGPPADDAGLPNFTGWLSSRVYEPHLLLRSWLIALENETLTLPESIRTLVEAVYSNDSLNPPPELQAIWDKTLAMLQEHFRKAKDEARNRFLPPPRSGISLAELSWDPSSEDDEAHRSVQALTRLGLPTVQVICLWDREDGLSLHKDDEDVVDLFATPDIEQARKLLMRSLPLTLPPSRQDLTRALIDATPRSWRSSPWLRNAYLLRLNPYGAPVTIGGFDVVLDDELGLVLSRSISAL